MAGHITMHGAVRKGASEEPAAAGGMDVTRICDRARELAIYRGFDVMNELIVLRARHARSLWAGGMMNDGMS